jgi:hypothetical protein
VICIESERLIELCEQGQEKIMPKGTAGDFQRGMHCSTPEFFADNVNGVLHSLANMAREAIKLAGQGKSMIAISQQDERMLAWALRGGQSE